ncbi:MAG: ECF transporter S component, partial [Christensenellaceae bacterium]|nr:ECF transporter S component [Christensenellaceae bacterium]
MSNESIREKNLNRILYITRVGVLSALAVILFLYGNFPIFPVFPFNVLKLDFASVPTLLAGFALGPMAGAITVVIKVGIKLLVDPTTTMYVGELADFISSLAFVLPAACLYKYKKSISGAVIGLSIGVVLNALITSIANYALIVPIYVKLMPFLAETFTEKVRLQFAFGYGLAFNGIRTVSCSVITLAVYKRLRFLLKETASERDKKQADKKTLNETHPRKPSFLGMKFRQITRPLLPFMAFGAVVLRVWAWKNFDYRVKKAELKAARKMLDKGAGLILTAHNGPTDIIVPVLVGRRKMALAARTYAFPSEFYTKLFYFTGNCVERQDIELDIGFIKEVKSRIDGGISTLIYPDARYSRNGIVDVAPFDGIPKLAKYLKCPIVCIKTPGVYLTRAFYRVERGFFKGHIDCDITSISKEDVQKLSIQELKDLIRSAVDGNDYEWQEQNNAEFHSKKYSQTVCLDSFIYKAPVCGADFKIQTNDDNTIQ